MLLAPMRREWQCMLALSVRQEKLEQGDGGLGLDGSLLGLGSLTTSSGRLLWAECRQTHGGHKR